MDTEDLKIGVIICLVVIGVVFLLYWATDRSIEECRQGCQKLEIEYFKFVDGVFGADKCWCVKDKEPKQIY